MIRKTALSMIVAAGLLGGIQGAAAQTSSPVTCRYTWCWTHVQVSQNAAGTPVATLTWNEFRMQKKLSGVTLAWLLVGSPDYELRADSVVITGANAAGSSAQFPLRQSSANNFPMDDLNTNDLTYTYQVRVYKKGSPPGSAPVTVTGSIVNAFN
jgi:hypothetical protein